MTTLGRRKKCLRNRSEKGHLRALRAHPMRNRPLPAPLETPLDQHRLKTCTERSYGIHESWNLRVKTEIPVYIANE